MHSDKLASICEDLVFIHKNRQEILVHMKAITELMFVSDKRFTDILIAIKAEIVHENIDIAGEGYGS
jgi:hypothetical protein